MHSGPSSHLTSPPMLDMHRHSPDGYDRQQAQDSQMGKWKSEKEKEKEGPVKNACLSCRSKKAKCDGVLPICGQVCREIWNIC